MLEVRLDRVRQRWEAEEARTAISKLVAVISEVSSHLSRFTCECNKEGINEGFVPRHHAASEQKGNYLKSLEDFT